MTVCSWFVKIKSELPENSINLSTVCFLFCVSYTNQCAETGLFLIKYIDLCNKKFAIHEKTKV